MSSVESDEVAKGSGGVRPASDPRLVVGIVGLGVMGSAIARNLIAGGVDVIGHDIDPGRQDAFAASGGRPAASAAAVARAAGTVLLLLPSPGALQAVSRGPDGLAAGIGRGSIIVEMSTLAVADKTALRDLLQPLGATVLDVPISGTGGQAETGDLVLYASGDAAAIETFRKLIAPAVREVYAVGPFGAGSRVKILANHLVAVHIAAAAEALALARQIGVDPELAVAVLSSGAGTSRMLELRGPMMAARRYRPASMTMRLFAKDLGIIGDAARAAGVETPLFDAAVARFDGGRDRGLDDLDTASVHEVAIGDQADPIIGDRADPIR